MDLKCHDAAPINLEFFEIMRLGPVQTAGHPANKVWMSRKFFLLPGIFSLKFENHFQKNFAKKLRRVRSQFVIGSAIRGF